MKQHMIYYKCSRYKSFSLLLMEEMGSIKLKIWSFPQIHAYISFCPSIFQAASSNLYLEKQLARTLCQ